MRVYNVYFASCVKNGGIYHYHMDSTGRLSFVDKSACDRPMYMIRDGGRLYVVLREPFYDNCCSGIISYEIDEQGRLHSPTAPISTKGRCGCHLCVLDGRIYAANYLSGSVFCSDGTLRIHVGCGKDNDRHKSPHPHCIVPTPDRKYLLTADLGLNRIVIYDRGLNQIGDVSMPEGAGPRHIAWLDSTQAVCVNELGCSVTRLLYRNGTLTPEETISVRNKNCISSTCAAIRVMGKHIYVSNRGEDSLVVLQLGEDGLEVVSIQPCGGCTPRDFVMGGGFLLCANQDSGTVTLFRNEAKRLIPMRDSTVTGIPDVLCVCGDWEEGSI